MFKQKIFYMIIPIFLLLIGCSKISDEELRVAHNAFNKGALLIDVRTKEEFKEKHANKAVNIPVQLLERYYKYLPKDKEIIVYCQTGSRSHMAAEFLEKKGRKVYDVKTQEDWERELLPSSNKLVNTSD